MVSRRSGPGQVLLAAASLLLPVAGALEAASTRELTLFTIASRSSGERFVVGSDDPAVIARCRQQLALPVEERTLHINGRLEWGHGGHNLGYAWHIDPDGWDLAEESIELCDGRPSFVEGDLEYWVEIVGSFCPWSSYVAFEGPPYRVTEPAAVTVALEPVVSGLDQPVAVTGAGDGSGLLYVVEKPGRVRVVEAGAVRAQPFLDISSRVGLSGSEQGLLGIAFAPDFAASGAFYVNYTDLGGDTTVSRFSVDAGDPSVADPGSEQVLLRIAQPYANHNGGDLAFGPDGMLWIGTGDGGSAGDPEGNAQDGGSLLGKMLRVDVRGGGGYTIPSDNPFLNDDEVRDEVWAVGLRNPWRYAFDRAAGDLYIADVGQNAWEEVNFAAAVDPGGHNYGWNRTEGMHCYRQPSCSTDGLTEPVAEYGHGEGCSITGGVVYRGRRNPALEGLYLFADYCSGRVWALAPGGRTGWRVAEVGRIDGNPAAFGEDDEGEVFLADISGGTLYRVSGRRVTVAPRPGARRLSR